ncbi:PREDICTED: uncharacterized protein LOC109185223 [Ipomoea nil]|uniref:uncharacterized protein LOC109185223 n=1 Tax=Ipomoea nil TaxID=35883 RepID=UPI000900F6E7|nr:PREDICTED: uncharacterized protein LOC109185223 [Ipomoea nil]
MATRSRSQAFLLALSNQAPRAWFNRLHAFMMLVGFKVSKIDVSFFHYLQDSTFIYVLVYVDDILVMGSDQNLVSTLLAKLSTEFKIKELGEPGFFLGIETVKCGDGILLSQQRYMTDILKRAGMTDCKSLATSISVSKPTIFDADLYDDATQYRSLAGALQYLTGTITYGLRIRKSVSRELHAFSDSDWAGYPEDHLYDDPTHYRSLAGALQHLTITRPDLTFAVIQLYRKSTSGFAVFLGTNLISWVYKKQRAVARSSTKAKYKALVDVCAEVLWIISLLHEIKVPGTDLEIFVNESERLKTNEIF